MHLIVWCCSCDLEEISVPPLSFSLCSSVALVFLQIIVHS